MVIQGSMRPEAKSYSIVDPAIYSSISQRLEYPIFGAIHRVLFNSFHFFSILHGLELTVYTAVCLVNIIKLSFIIAIPSSLCTVLQVNEIN